VEGVREGRRTGGATIVPIYNVYVVVKISGNDWWWLLLFFVPFVDILALLKVSIDVAERFGQGLGFGLGLGILSFVFWTLLGFGGYSVAASACRSASSRVMPRTPQTQENSSGSVGSSTRSRSVSTRSAPSYS
jgi:hypothetical protein